MAHYFDQCPSVESHVRTVQFSLEARNFDFLTDSGVFSKGGLDIGTEQLLRAAIRDLRDDPIRGAFLDLGCGYGPVGIALKRIFSGIDVTMVDVNQRALELARQNAGRNGVSQVRILESDGYQALPGERFNVILTNPPIRAGKETVYRFFDEAVDHLSPGGRLYAVVGKKQGAPSAERHLASVMGNCKRIAREKGFWVFRCDAPAGEAEAGPTSLASTES